MTMNRMKHFIKLSDLSRHEAFELFRIADEVQQGGYAGCLTGNTIVMFFPEASIRTRVTFERGIHLLGGQTILFPPSALDKKEALQDVAGYLNNWVQGAVIRHKEMAVLEEFATYAAFPVINAMTDVNHPCEILTDLYALHKMGRELSRQKVLFVGAGGNIGLAWKEAAELFGFDLVQSCPPQYAMDGVENIPHLAQAAVGRDIICTDSLGSDKLSEFAAYQVTSAIMSRANPGALLNPCPPFYRGEEVSAEVIDSEYFVGYAFKSLFSISPRTSCLHLFRHISGILLAIRKYGGAKFPSSGEKSDGAVRTRGDTEQALRNIWLKYNRRL